MNEIEMRYKGIKGLLSLAGSEKEISRGCFEGIDDDLVSFAGHGLDEAVHVFRRAVDEYLAGHATSDVTLRRVAPRDAIEGRKETGRCGSLVAPWEPEEMEGVQSLDGLLDQAERLGFLISRKLMGREPGRIVESIGGAVSRGVERAYKEAETTSRGLGKGRESGHVWRQRAENRPKILAAALS
jgi:hypothetical protein